MTERHVVIGHRLGLHARAAARVVQLSAGYRSTIVLLRSGEGAPGKGKDPVEADARSILSILFLAAGVGTTLTVRATGDDEAEAVDCLCEYLKG